MFNEAVSKLEPKGVLSIISNANAASLKSRENVGFKKIDAESPYANTDWYLRSF